MKNFFKGIFKLFTIKELLAMFGLGVCGAVIACENRKQGYKEGVNDCIEITKEVLDESKAKDTAE